MLTDSQTKQVIEESDVGLRNAFLKFKYGKHGSAKFNAIARLMAEPFSQSYNSIMGMPLPFFFFLIEQCGKYDDEMAKQK